MNKKRLLIPILICLSSSFAGLTASPSMGRGGPEQRPAVRDVEEAPEQRTSRLNRIMGRGDRETPAADQAETRPERAAAQQERAETARERVRGERDTTAADQAEARRERAEAQRERAESARERSEAAPAAEERRPGFLRRIFGGGSSADEEAAQPGAEARAAGQQRAQEAQGKFSTEERAVLENWQRGQADQRPSERRLPPGLQRKVDRGGELPPGWKKKLAVGERLPEEYETKTQSLPDEVIQRLPQSVEGTEILQIGDEVIRVMDNTREIVDILGLSRGRAE